MSIFTLSSISIRESQVNTMITAFTTNTPFTDWHYIIIMPITSFSTCIIGEA